MLKIRKTAAVGRSEGVARQLGELASQRAYNGTGLRLKMIAYQVRQAWVHRPFGK